MKPFIGIKRVFYGNPITEDITKESLKSWLQSAKEVKNVHQDTWGYSHDDPNVTEYKNELTGQIYHRDITDGGAKTINFTLGVYEIEDKVALQGGSAISGNLGWKAPETPVEIKKAIVAQTKTGNYIIFTNANIIAKGNFVEKNVGLGITAVAMETGIEGVSHEYNIDGDKMNE